MNKFAISHIRKGLGGSLSRLCLSCAFLSSIAFTPAAAQTSISKEKDPLREITVSADARSIQGVIPRCLTYTIEADGKNAAEAFKSLEDLFAKTKSVLPDSIKSSLRVRGETLSSASSKSAPVSRNASVKMRRYVALTLEKDSKISTVIDSLLSSGASSISDIEYYSPGEESAQMEAIKEASEKAKAKAQNVANSLGVRLGTILSQSVTEESAGASMRNRMQKGGYAPEYQEKEVNVYVTARYQVFAK